MHVGRHFEVQVGPENHSTLTAEGFVTRSFPHCWKHQYKKSKCIFCFHLFDAEGCQHNIRSSADSQLAPQAEQHRWGKCFRLTHFVSTFSTQTVVSMTEKLSQTHNWLHKHDRQTIAQLAPQTEKHRGSKCFRLTYGCFTSWRTSWRQLFQTQATTADSELIPRAEEHRGDDMLWLSIGSISFPINGPGFGFGCPAGLWRWLWLWLWLCVHQRSGSSP